MKKFLLMMLLVVSSLSVWGQPFYKFTATADGKLYTDANDASIATTPKGAVCNSSYYVKSDYVNTTAPSTTTSSAFSTKAYYVKDGDNYTCAFGQSYNTSKDYATVASNIKLLGEELNAKLSSVLYWTSGAVSDGVHHSKYNSETSSWEDSGISVQSGEVCSPSGHYYVLGADRSGTDLKDWEYRGVSPSIKYTTSATSFSTTSGIYTCEGEGENVVFTQISSLDYDEDETYYAVTFSDLSDEQETTMATNASNFSSATIVTGLSEPSGIYYYDGLTASYKLVRNGDDFLGEDKYYIPGSSFALMTPAELLVLGYVDDVYGLVSLEPSTDGQTLSVICAGDVCDPEEDYESTGYKFQNLALDWLFSDELGTVVANNDMYVNKPYYTRVPKYDEIQNSDVDTYSKNVLLNESGIYSYDESTKSLTLINEGADVTTASLKKIAGDEVAINIDEDLESKYLFKSNNGGFIYKVIDSEHLDNASSYQMADWNHIYDPDATYVRIKNAWNPGANYDENVAFVFGENTDLFNEEKYFKTNIFKKEGDKYKDVSETKKEDDATYVKGISFSDILTEDVSENVICVNTSSNTYYKGDSKVVVSNGEVYEPSTTYFVGNGYDYTEKTKEALISENKLTNVTIANNYWEALVNDINKVGYKTVKFVSQDSSHPAQICNNVTQAFMNATTVRVLDYSDVAISSIDSPFSSLAMTNPNQDTSGNNLGTFMCGANGMGYNYSVETLYTPQVTTADFELLQKSFAYFHELRNLHLSDGIVTLGEKSIDANGTFMRLSTITFPNTLKTIKEYAVANHKVMAADTNPNKYGSPSPYAIESLTFPAGLEKIYTNAFQGTCPKDVYFLGVEAPNVDKYAWGDDAYISNNALKPAAASLSGVTVDQSTGYSTRMNYIAQSGWIAMLHYPAACTKDQAAKYTDVTRHYYRIENYKVGNTVDASKVNTDATPNYNTDNTSIIYDGEFAYYTPGLETENLTGTGATSLAAEKRFQNRYGNYNTNGVGAYTGGFYDYTVGSQILWPSISMAYRATVVAQNDVLWNGVTTIGQGIRDAGNGSFEGDGTEYIGLHQFVLASADVMTTSTYEYDMLKYADGKWHTICVPFNMTKKQMKETFGASDWHLSDEAEIIAGNYVVCNENKYTGEYEHLRLCEFSAVVRTEDNITIKFNKEMFIEADDDDIVLKAHTPYMIHAAKGELVEGGEATAKFYGYQMESGSPGFTNVTSTGNANNGVYTFKGNYSSFTTDGSNHAVYMPLYSYFFNGTAQAYRFQIGTEGKWTPYAAIVEAPNGADDNAKYFTTSVSSRVRTMFFGDIDDEETAIEKIAIEADGELIYTNAPVYNLSGQVVGNSLDNLAPGIYIVNGKKYMIR